MLEAAISAAEELNSPIIIGTAEILLPSGELDLIAPSIIEAAKRAKVPVVVHYDHGLTFERCMQALKLGFSSVMFDGSAGDAEQNIKDTANIVKIAHAFDATVEGEIGHVGEAATGDNAVSDNYTTRLKAIREKVDTPLVLHGGSGLSDDDFKNTVKNGIAKVNIFTDLLLAGIEGMKEGLEKELPYLAIRDLKVAKIKEAVKTKIRLFGSENKA